MRTITSVGEHLIGTCTHFCIKLYAETAIASLETDNVRTLMKCLDTSSLMYANTDLLKVKVSRILRGC